MFLICYWQGLRLHKYVTEKETPYNYLLFNVCSTNCYSLIKALANKINRTRRREDAEIKMLCDFATLRLIHKNRENKEIPQTSSRLSTG